VLVDEVAHQLQIVIVQHMKLVIVQHMKLSTAGLLSIKSVQGGSQSNSKNCTERNVWTSANSLWMAVVLKVTTAWKESSWEMKPGTAIMSQIVNILIHPPRKSSILIQRQKAYAYSFLELTTATNGTLSREGFNCEQCSLQ